MNETLSTLLKRRSIRNYRAEQIKDDELNEILKAGQYAPSGMNRQPWHFTIVQNKKLLNKINELVRESLLKDNSQNQAMKERVKAEDFSVFYKAPTLIVVSGKKDIFTTQYDCVLAMGNMFNAAASLGIGSCWIHAVAIMLNSESGKELLEELRIPEGDLVICSGAFGYIAGEIPLPAPRKENVINILRD
jgi:nitroreductase